MVVIILGGDILMDTGTVGDGDTIIFITAHTTDLITVLTIEDPIRIDHTTTEGTTAEEVLPMDLHIPMENTTIEELQIIIQEELRPQEITIQKERVPLEITKEVQ